MLKKLITEEGGFTLVELLVTIAILAVLFGVVTLSLSGIGSDAEETVNDAELGVVQSAIDIAIADNNIDGTSVTTHSCDFVTGTETLSGSVTIGEYLRLTGSQSKCKYDWGTEGEVTQATDCTGSCP
jgi:prepilin-type N-terminal cleavage/methylation domain-containing protein